MTDQPTRRILKWNVPVDDQPHQIGAGRVVRVECQHGPESVQVWTDDDPHDPTKPGPRLVQVYGTGHPIPRTAGAHLGSATHSGLVWHVLSMAAPGGFTIEMAVDHG